METQELLLMLNNMFNATELAPLTGVQRDKIRSEYKVLSEILKTAKVSNEKSNNDDSPRP